MFRAVHRGRDLTDTVPRVGRDVPEFEAKHLARSDPAARRRHAATEIAALLRYDPDSTAVDVGQERVGGVLLLPAESRALMPTTNLWQVRSIIYGSSGQKCSQTYSGYPPPGVGPSGATRRLMDSFTLVGPAQLR